jgi:hypothetical protein
MQFVTRFIILRVGYKRFWEVVFQESAKFGKKTKFQKIEKKSIFGFNHRGQSQNNLALISFLPSFCKELGLCCFVFVFL